MRIHTGISRRSNKSFVLFLLDMLPIFFQIIFWQPKIDNEYLMMHTLTADHKILWLYISMDYPFFMESLNPRYHLICY